DREDRPDERYRWDHRMNARAIGESSVDERTCQVDPPAEGRDEALDKDEDLLGIGKVNWRLLEPPVSLDPHAAGAIDHDLGHPIVAEQRSELAETEQAVLEPALEQSQLTRRDNDKLVDERLAQRRRRLVP